MKIILAFLAFLLISPHTQAQQYKLPVNVPISLSSNFAELRPNHLHSGVDIKMAAYPASRREVVSTADGYIARVYVNPYGFGKAIYIYHPATKTTSVYGHLDCFSDEITKYVRAEQYRKKSFALNYYLKPTDIPVKAGDKIGVAGNSGMSGGIHLHYELRNSKEEPINLVKVGLITVMDNIPPAIVSVSVVEIDTCQGSYIFVNKGRFPATKTANGIYKIPNAISINRPSYLTIEYVDRKNGVQNSFGIYSMCAKINGKRYFGFSLDNIDFKTTRYTNSLSEFYKNRASAYSVARLYVSENNKLKIYDSVKERGILNPASLPKNNDIVITLTDDSNNSSQVSLTLTTEKNTATTRKYSFTANSHVIKCDQATLLKSPNAELTIPVDAFYDNDIVDFYSLDGKSPYSKDIYLKGVYMPTQKGMTLKIKEDNLPENLRSKAIVARVNSSGGRASMGGKWEDGYVTAIINDNGKFMITTDTTAPYITSKQEKGTTIKGSKLRFTISDNLSGIATFNGYVDGKWEVFSLDGKSALLEYEINNYDSTSRKHDVKIDITDAKGNKKIYQTYYYW